jgi:uncharacterized protein
MPCYISGMKPAGVLLREARCRAGLSQVELGRRAGLTQSVVSAYETGARQPSLPTLARLISVTGYELDMRLLDEPGLDSIGGVLGERIRRHGPQLREVLARHGLSNPRVFGSVSRGEERAGSDVDLLVDVPAGIGLVTLGRCQAELEALLGAHVDLVPAGDLKPRLADAVLADAVAI